MEPAIVVALLWLLFSGTHVGLATRGVRDRLVARLGEGGFFGLFSLIATLTFWAVMAFYAAHRFDGAAGLAAGRIPLVRWLLMGVITAGVALVAAGLTEYARLPMAMFGQPIRPPRGIERITRHPFFAGTALLGLAHMLLATRLVGAIVMAGLAVLAIVGARHQDAKHVRMRGRPYADYMAATSFVPFAAIVAGRQQLVPAELPFGAFGAGIGVTVVLRLVHDGLFAHGGIWIVVAIAGGGALASWQSWRRSRRVGALAARARA